ncbi:hypothetical protein M23134_07232 [Microscilla marina ATCC 23134]|uniref:Uncharacterized protein n=1 Tax=Microscilla marina ATCC 23134 TaxID=313606 RepID=A1ZX62_MICM2|nr:hypothetical protein M23134_07232 [Microscilla marina ATCC 23134]
MSVFTGLRQPRAKQNPLFSIVLNKGFLFFVNMIVYDW